jgi:hypothetical protein
MLSKVFKGLLLGAVLCSQAYAIPVEWSVDGLVRDDGGTVSGSFVYDADTNTYSAINITTTQGSSSLPGETYSGFSIPVAPSATFVLFERTQRTTTSPPPDYTDQNTLAFQFAPGLTNAGGSVAPSFMSESACGDIICSVNSPTVTLSGVIVGTPVPPSPPTPVPALSLPVLGLLVAIVLGFGLRRLRRG